MIGENWQLVTEEPVEFEKSPVQVQDWRRITDRFRGVCRIDPNLVKGNRRMSTCNRLDLQTLESPPVMPKSLPDHWFRRLMTSSLSYSMHIYVKCQVSCHTLTGWMHVTYSSCNLWVLEMSCAWASMVCGGERGGGKCLGICNYFYKTRWNITRSICIFCQQNSLNFLLYIQVALYGLCWLPLISFIKQGRSNLTTHWRRHVQRSLDSSIS